jgi:hypothetical protein
VIQLEPLVTVQLHPFAVVTPDDSEAADAEGEWEVGFTVNAHPLPWFTVTVSPAIVRVPVRGGPVFAATLKVAGPPPVRLLPPGTVIQLTPLVIVQLHPVPVVTVDDSDAAPDVGEYVVGTTVNVQGAPENEN